MNRCIVLLSVACALAFGAGAEPVSEPLNPVVPFLAITGRPTEADVAAKVEALKADGFDQFLVYARSGLQYRYMGEEWLRTVEACCHEGEKRGMKVWLYDEFNWPSGTCKGRVPALDERFRYSEWAVYPKAGGGYRWEIVYAPAGWVNVCEPEAMRAFIRMTHEVYEKRLAKYFASKTIPGIFSDEPGHPTDVKVGKDCVRHFRRWIGMEDEYRAETGRDFRADVEAFLAGKGSSDVWAAYLRLMGRRFRTCYFDQIRAWCDKMGISLTGHLISENWLTDSLLYNGDPLLALKGESLPGMDEIFSVADWNKWTEWLTLATVQHAAYRVGNGGLVELYACGPNDMTPARMRQMIWLCALHGVDHYLTSMQVMDQRGLVEKHGYFSPMQNGQPWHGELRPLFADAKRAAALARRPDVVRHAAVRLPLAATAQTAFNKLEHPKLAELLRSCGGRQLSLDLIAEDEKTDLPYVFESLADGGFRETTTGTGFAGKDAADRAAAWLLQRTTKAARFYEADGKVAEGLIVREWSDGTVAALDVMNRSVRKLELVRGTRRTPVELAPRGMFVSDGAYPETITVNAARQVPLALGAMSYALDRDNVFRAPFATNRIARFTVKAPVKGARLVLRTCAMSYAVTASGRPVDDTEGAPPNERVLRHVAVPYSFELDGRTIAAARPADSLPVEFRPLYAETEPMDLTPGEHVLKLVTGEDDCNYFLPAAFVAGRFAVQGNALVSLPEKLTTVPVAAQGLSNYCGQVTYALDGVTRPEGATALRLDVGNVFARVRWNGVDLGGRGWAPYEWKLPADAAKTGRLEVTVFTSVWNIFGERERPDAKWDTHFWNAQHDPETNPSLKSAVWIKGAPVVVEPACAEARGWTLSAALSDEFDGAALDRAKWDDWCRTFQGRMDRRQPLDQCSAGFIYSPKNVSIENGELTMTARKLDESEKTARNAYLCYAPYSSSIVKSVRKQAYGYFEIRAKTMKACINNAFWLYDALDDEPRVRYSPGDVSEEIDIFEQCNRPDSRGKVPDCSRTYFNTIHFYCTPYLEGIVNYRKYEPKDLGCKDVQRHAATKLDFDLCDDYHTYGFLWTPEKLVWYLDGKVTWERTNDFFHRPMHVTFTTEFFPGWFGLPADSELPAKYRVDYVRVWECPPPRNTALVPRMKIEPDGYDWFERHDKILKYGRQTNPEIVFIGDSITHFWAGTDTIGGEFALPRWKKAFGKYRTLNLGYGWDRTGNVLWRLDHGEMDGVDPKLVVIHIGGNNYSTTRHYQGNTSEEVAEAILAIAAKAHEKAPKAKVVVMGVFPFGEKPDAPHRQKALKTNAILAEKVPALGYAAFIDLTAKQIGADGIYPKELARDRVHPTDAGYDIWAEELKPYLP